MLQPQRSGQERILAIGHWGTGKSYAWLSIARLAQKTGSPARFFCIDTDAAIPRMLSEEFQDLANVTVTSAHEWQEYELNLDSFVKQATSQDWIVVDMIDLAWEAVQSYYVEQVFGKSIDDYWLEVRKALKGQQLKVLDGWRDWSVINKIYSSWIGKLVYQAKAHVFATAKVEPISRSSDDEETIDLYNAYGLKPRGQKHLGHQFHSVLLFSKDRDGWTLTTIKDRGRQLFEKQKLVNFPMQYLVGKAGWKV